MPEKPTLFVCHGDDGGPWFHPCRRVQEALRDAGIEYEKVIAAHGSPIPFLRRGSREALFRAIPARLLRAPARPNYSESSSDTPYGRVRINRRARLGSRIADRRPSP
jgi:hypothetical protein